MFNINQLQHFRLVAQTGNFALAARMIHITQPALSNSIRTLEERTGIKLFDRSERPIRLTPGGRDLLDRIDSLLKEARNLEKEITLLSQGMAGKLRVGMTAVSSASIGGAILGTWQAQHQRMSADVTVADTLTLLDLLRAENLDLIIGDSRDLPNPPSGLDIVPIPVQPGGVFCRSGHPALKIKALTFQDLLAFRFAGSHFPVSVLDHLARMFNLRDRNDVEVAIDSDNIALLRDATIHSDLILMTTPGCIRNALNAGLLVELPIEMDTSASWYSVTLKNATLHPAIPSLRAAIEKVTAVGPNAIG